MLDIGIVGLKNSAPFIGALAELSAFNLKGIYDPCLLMDRCRQTDFNVFQSFDDLCNQCQCVIFCIDDNLYHPLISEAIRHALDVFVAGVQNYETKQLNSLLMLRDEADSIVHIGHQYIYSDMFQTLRRCCGHPLDIQCRVEKNQSQSMVLSARAELGMVLALVKASVHKVSVNVFSSFSTVPDSIRVRLDFDNGAVGNISIDKFGFSPVHYVKILNYNNIVEADFLQNKVSVINSDNPEYPSVQKLSKHHQSAIERQLMTFYSCIMGGNEVHNNLENEIRTQLACERIHEKLRVNFNLF